MAQALIFPMAPQAGELKKFGGDDPLEQLKLEVCKKQGWGADKVGLVSSSPCQARGCLAMRVILDRLRPVGGNGGCFESFVLKTIFCFFDMLGCMQFSKSSRKSTLGPKPLYLSTANQLGLERTRGVPSLLDHVLPKADVSPPIPAAAQLMVQQMTALFRNTLMVLIGDNCCHDLNPDWTVAVPRRFSSVVALLQNKHLMVKLWMKQLLMSPPPQHVAAAVRDATEQLLESNGGFPAFPITRPKQIWCAVARPG